MAIDNKYIALNYLQQYFVNTDDGLPLSAGVVKFYSDAARTVPKDVFKLNGAPTYTYETLGNELTLGSAGTFVDESGNDITVFAYPYDSNDDVELYYVTIDSADGLMPTDTRSGIPYIETGSEVITEYTNYIPNGQFAVHNDIPDSGLITAPITYIAPGGWTFERPNAATSTDYVTFAAFNGYITNPPGSPRFACRVRCTSPDGTSAYKKLRLTFPDVNKFASTTQYYTWAIYASTNSGTTTTVSMILYKYYGAGGSTATSVTLEQPVIGNVYESYATQFVFGVNTGKTIVQGTDFVALDINFPPTSIFDVSITCCLLIPGEVNSITTYPTETDADTKYKSIAGWMPTPSTDGFDLYCNLILSRQGLAFDHSDIGRPYFYLGTTAPTSYLLMNGGGYNYNAWSSDGIPYYRLGDVLWYTTGNIFKYGTGPNYFCSQVSTNVTAELRIINNDTGPVTNTADGTVTTGFTFSNCHKPSVATYKIKAYLTTTTTFLIELMEIGGVAHSINASTSGFTCLSYQLGTALIPQIYTVTTVAATSLAGKYFHFSTLISGVDTWVYVWYTVSGSGSDPAPGSHDFGIKVDVTTADTAAIVAQKTREAINTWQISYVVTKAASTVTQSSYFTCSSSGLVPVNYYIWYNKDGGGTDPAVAGKTGIEVEILAADTAAQVATKTMLAINKARYAVPDWRGLFIRAIDGGAGLDPDAATRWSLVPGVIGDIAGTFQLDEIISHRHSLGDSGDIASGAGDVVHDARQGNFAYQSDWVGGAETRPDNANTNYIIKY